MNGFADFVIQVFTQSGETVLIAKIVKALSAELARRAENAAPIRRALSPG
jgi:hypothetical protein